MGPGSEGAETGLWGFGERENLSLVSFDSTGSVVFRRSQKPLIS